MKKLIIALILIQIFIMGGCSEKMDPVESNNSVYSGISDDIIEDPNNAKPANPEEVTEEIKQKTIQNFKEEMEAMRVSDISEFEMSFYAGLGTETHSTTDKDLIQRWLSFFNKFELSAEPYMPRNGVAYGFAYTVGTEKKYWCSGPFPILDYDYKYTQFTVENFSELKDEFESLKSEMGFSSN